MYILLRRKLIFFVTYTAIKKFDRYYNEKKFLQGYVNLQMHKACITGDSGKLQFYNIFFTNINPDYQIYFLKIKHTKLVLD